MEGALQVVGRFGCADATVARIARAAGLAPGLIHYHFRDKQEILAAVTASLVDRMDQRLRSRLAAAPAAPVDRLDAAVDAYLALNEDADPEAVAAWVALGTEASRDARVRVLYAGAVERARQQWEALVEPCLPPRERTTQKVRWRASALVATIEGAYRLAVSAPGALPAGFAAPMVRRMARGLVDGGGAR